MTLINGKILESKKTDLFQLIFFHQSCQGYSAMRLSFETNKSYQITIDNKSFKTSCIRLIEYHLKKFFKVFINMIIMIV
jgi:hypothetical protein